MDDLISIILKARRKGIFRSRPIFDCFSTVSENELLAIEAKINCKLPVSLRQWLLSAGYGDINESLSFRKNWFQVIDRGQLEGHVIFAQDILGNFYAFNPYSEDIFYISRSYNGYASVATDFQTFLLELIERDYHLGPWMDSLELKDYSWRD